MYAFVVLVAEVTQVSLGVGYEIGRAVAMEKPILCLYRPQPDKSMSYYNAYGCDTVSLNTGLSAMIRGAEDGDKIKVIDYQEEHLQDILKSYFKT